MAQRNSYCLVYHSQKNAEAGALGIASSAAYAAKDFWITVWGKKAYPSPDGWGKKAYPSPEAATFQASRVVEDIALADMLAEAMRAGQEERMQDIQGRINASSD